MSSLSSKFNGYNFYNGSHYKPHLSPREKLERNLRNRERIENMMERLKQTGFLKGGKKIRRRKRRKRDVFLI